VTGLEDSTIKHRDVCFSRLHPNRGQAVTAFEVLRDLEGILHVAQCSETCIKVRYDLRRITLNLIEGLLADLGFHLDNSLMSKLKRALYYYTEETECANLGCGAEHHAQEDIFISHYVRRPHGCRDLRPTHWRQYL